jgi:F-type H+-transporting ATPase subunit a
MSNFTYTDIPSPLDQFEIRDLLSLNAPILNNLHIGLYLTIATLLVLSLNVLAINFNKLISNN